MKYLQKFDNRQEYESSVVYSNSVKSPSCTLIEDTKEVIYDTATLPFSTEDIKLRKPLTFNIRSNGTII
jgi:hypothetical protein